jgi:hypothetical protein
MAQWRDGSMGVPWRISLAGNEAMAKLLNCSIAYCLKNVPINSRQLPYSLSFVSDLLFVIMACSLRR